MVRLSNGAYGVGSHCYFPSDGVEHDDVLPRVDSGVYSSGRSKPQQENAKKFLAEIGVREVGEAEQVEAILNQKYKSENFKPKKQELKRFIALVETEPHRARLFANYFIFEGNDGKWHQPAGIFLDQPFMDTGLSTYYDTIGANTKCSALAESYASFGISVKRIAKFAETVGARIHLELMTTTCQGNPQRSYLHSVSGDRYTSPIDRDYTIASIEDFLATPALEVSKLVWRTMSSLPSHPNFLQATYQKNERWGARYADSQLVHHLRNVAWIPQTNGSFVRPSEATPALLPEGFPFDPGWPWIKAIQFGQDAVNRSEVQLQKQSLAEKFGFGNTENMERAKRFAALPRDEQERFLSERERSRDIELPEHEPANPERRAQRVGGQAQDAPERLTEERTRSISVGREAVKEDAAQVSSPAIHHRWPLDLPGLQSTNAI